MWYNKYGDWLPTITETELFLLTGSFPKATVNASRGWALFFEKEVAMQHYFDIDIATKLGVNCAVILQNLAHWIKQNEANKTNFFDGDYWTFNSRRAYKELFPYMSERQINTAFEKLIENGLIKTGNYNKVAYDRTLWYALTKKGKSILHFDIMDNDNLSNRLCQNVKPIPNNKQPYNIKEIIELYNTICTSLPRVVKVSSSRERAIKARLNGGYTLNDFKTCFTNAQSSAFLCGQNNRGWKADFDWLISDTNICKVIEGRYNDGQPKCSAWQDKDGGWHI